MKRLLLLAGAAALPACSQPFSEGDDGIPEPRAAYYMVQPQDLLGLPTDGVPAPDLTQYGFLVCNTGLDPERVRAAAPQATLFVYMSSHFVGTWGPNSEILNALRATFDSTSFWVDSLGQRASTWENTEELLYTVENGEKLADFALEYLGGWDGIYIDDCWVNLSPFLYQKLPVTQQDWPQVEQDWDAFFTTFLTRLRAGTPQLIVGNCGAGAVALRDAGLDGFATEEWTPAQRPTVLDELPRYDPSLCVTWEWDAWPLARPGENRYH